MANKRLNGIVIEIGGDTSKLDKALKGVETEASKAKSELRDVNRVMKYAPESAELWRQKQELLTKVLDESRNKLNLLTKSQKSLSQQLADGDIDQKQYDKFKEKIKKTKAKLEELKNQQGDFEKKLADNEIDQGAYDKFKEKVDKTAKELKNLESSEKSLEERVKIGDITEEQYRAFQREVEKAKNDVNYFNNELRNLRESANQSSDEVDDLSEAVENAGEEAENSGNGGFTVLKGAVANLASEGIKKAIDGFKELATEGDTALNTLQARTGATAQEMDEYKDVMRNIYAENFGEDRNDIASSISEVKQQLGDIDSEQLEDVTKTALLLRDTFDFEVNESVRAANMLMCQFGVTADEAYTLIAQGAQNGLNKNGDLLDTINEYSVHYKQQGYSAEQFFNSLVNGASAGTFSVDKLGDAMKEFGIRTKDTADSTTEGFTLIGLNADEMRRKFAVGGESAQEATRQTLDALFSLNDQVKQNQAGVDLFGTMWEDLGIDGVKALMDVTGEANKTKSTLQDIADVQYNDLGSQFEQLSRQVKTDLLEPAAEKLLPKIKGGADWMVKNLPNITEKAGKLVPIVKTIGESFLLMKGTQLFSNGITKAKSLIETIKDLGSAGGSVGMSLNAKTMLVAGSFKLIHAIGKEMFRDLSSGTSDMVKELENYRDKCDESSKKLDDMKQSANEAAEVEIQQTEKTQALWKELQTLADHSGNVKKKDEERAEYIITELERATGEEIALVDGQIQKYEELGETFDQIFEKKKAMARLSSHEGNLLTAQEEADSYKDDYIKKRKEYEYWADPNNLNDIFLKELQFGNNYDAASAAQVEDYQRNLEMKRQEMELAEQSYKEKMSYIGDIKEAEKLAAEGKYNDANALLDYQKDINAKSIRENKGNSAEQVRIFQNMCDDSLIALDLALKSGTISAQQETADSLVNIVKAYTDGGMTSGEEFVKELVPQIQAAMDKGINFDAFILAAGEAGWDIGELLGSAAAARYQEIIAEQLRIENQQLYANNNLITHSINSPSDAALFQKGKYTLGVSKHATGGLIRYGEGIVAEAGPELIQVMQGGVRVTPLTATARNHAVDDLSKGQRVFYNNITINVAKVSSDYDVNRIAQQLAAEQKRIERGKGRW